MPLDGDNKSGVPGELGQNCKVLSSLGLKSVAKSIQIQKLKQMEIE